jgi:glycosyltransferase involved in cell wall biosynthesis
MIKSKNIIFLYSEVVGYLIPIFRILVNEYGYNVIVVYWDENRLKPYSLPSIKGVSFIPVSSFKKNELLLFCKKNNPNLVYVSGWMDKRYLNVTKILKKRNIPIVVGFDDMWKGNWRQKLGAIIFPWYYRKFFTYAWVAGPEQYEFARRLGFQKKYIIFDLLSANTDVFNREFVIDEVDIKKSFLYVGNFRKVKGTDVLKEAYVLYKEIYKGDWELICVGNGDMEQLLLDSEGIKIFPFASETELINISKEASVFILPSRNDQWGVVVHEFVSLGMALLLSENVGSKSTFFINRFNGLMYNNDSPEELAKKMHEFSVMDANKLMKMRQNSQVLAKRISSSTSVANLISIT